MKKVLISFLLGFLILVSAIAVVNATTINIDGDMADWAGVEPILTDHLGDGDLNEDILSCYVTNDGSNLYFRIDVAGTVIPNTGGGEETLLGPPFYMVALDVDQNSETGIPIGDIGAEYFVVAVYEVMELGFEYTCIILRLDELDEYENPIGISTADFSDGMLEFTCPLSLIGYPSSIDMIFQASVVEAATDTAPDTGHVTYNVEAPTIKADGNPTDWADIPWILEDDTEEPDVTDPMEDISRCYITNDDEVLYIRVDVVGEIADPTYVVFLVYFDTDTNPLTGVPMDITGSNIPLGIGAEAVAMWFPPGEAPPFRGSLWNELTLEGGVFVGAVSAYPAGNTFEIAIPLSWLGDSDEVDMVFQTECVGEPRTDWAGPIHYVMRAPPVGVRRAPPVGGEIVPIKVDTSLTGSSGWADYAVVFSMIAVMMGLMVYLIRRH